MGTQTVPLELPEELVALLGSPEGAAAKAREALVIELLREVQISQGLAARLLGLNRWQMLDFMVEHQIPSGPATAEEVREEFEAIHRYTRKLTARDGGQQQ